MTWQRYNKNLRKSALLAQSRGQIWVITASYPSTCPYDYLDIMITLIPGTRMGLKFFAMNLELENLLHRPVDLVIEGDLLPFAEKTANRDKVLVYARAWKRPVTFGWYSLCNIVGSNKGRSPSAERTSHEIYKRIDWRKLKACTQHSFSKHFSCNFARNCRISLNKGSMEDWRKMRLRVGDRTQFHVLPPKGRSVVLQSAINCYQRALDAEPPAVLYSQSVRHLVTNVKSEKVKNWKSRKVKSYATGAHGDRHAVTLCDAHQTLS